MSEGRLQPKRSIIAPHPAPSPVMVNTPLPKPQSERKRKRAVVKKHGKNTCKKENKHNAKHSDFSDLGEKPMMFRFLDSSRVQTPLTLLGFVRWNVVPESERGHFGLPPLQKDFAQIHGVSPDTLSNWKRLSGFWDEVALHRNNDFRRFTSEVYYGLVKRAITGDPRAVELFAKLFEGYSEKVRVENETPPKELSPEEIEKVKHALYNIGLKTIIKENKPDNPDEYVEAASL